MAIICDIKARGYDGTKESICGYSLLWFLPDAEGRRGLGQNKVFNPTKQILLSIE